MGGSDDRHLRVLVAVVRALSADEHKVLWESENVITGGEEYSDVEESIIDQLVVRLCMYRTVDARFTDGTLVAEATPLGRLALRVAVAIPPVLP